MQEEINPDAPWLSFQSSTQAIDPNAPWESFESSATQQPKEVDKQRIRAAASGLTLGFADEIEAMARSMVSSKSYEEIRDEIRKKVDDYRNAHPGEAISYEVLGALAPTALAFLSPIPGDEVAATAFITKVLAGSKSAKNASLAQKLKPAVKRGAFEGALAGYGTGEEDAVSDLIRVPFGAAIGVGLTGGTTLLLHPVGSLSNMIMTKLRTTFGDKGAREASRELQRIAQITGKTEEQILRDIHAGEIIADDPALKHIMSVLNAELSATGKSIDDVLIARAKTMKDSATQSMQEALTPGTKGNVHKAYLLSDKAAKKAESELYKKVFSGAKQLPREINESIEEAIVRLPKAQKIFVDIYKARGNIVPFFKILKNGNIKILRMPTLEDAEIVRRVLSEAANDAYKSGKGTIGGPLSTLERQLRGMLDDFSPALGNTRVKAATLRKSRTAYKSGRGSLNKNVDELSVEMEEMIGVSPTKENAEVLTSFRLGFMNALRDKIRKQPTFFNKASKEGENLNELLRKVFPEHQIDDVMKQINLAAKTYNTKINVLGGSPTAHRESAKDFLGLGSSLIQGDPNAIARVLAKVVSDLKPQLSAQQKNELVSMLISEDSDLVRRALIDSSAMAKLQNLINSTATGLLTGVQRVGIIESADVAGDVGNRAIYNLSQ